MRVRCLCATLVALATASIGGAETYPRYWQPVEISAADVPALLGRAPDSLAALRCESSGCIPIPLQVDERDATGAWVLSQGALPSADEVAELDDNDVLLMMLDDAGPRAAAAARAAGAVVEVEIADPLGFAPRFAYLGAALSRSESPQGYVGYDPELDRLNGRVSLGFASGVPQFLALRPDGENILDRLKIRATATFLWGLIGVTRTEQDLLPDAVTWKSGPVRVIRRQPLEIRMRFGIRSPLGSGNSAKSR